MKHKVNVFAWLLAGLLPMQTTMALADEAAGKPADMLIYINPQEYQHPIKLWHVYKDYWFEQGPVVETVAKEVMGSEFGKVGMCESNLVGNTLVKLQPKMFYNPHMKIFYGTIIASAYTGSGKPIGTYIGESQKTGYLDVVPAYQVEQSYKLAMQQVVTKMKADPAFGDAIKNGVPANETATPCSMVSVLPSIKSPQ
jgi:hypothetical protein